ncbi:MAG: chalcone isomerase family protein [Hahellaceae bacterium]|jgi:hypothetical protein|nr:chalcone isomerase family protein [Hahellaceae bacterium]MCP5210156.1 chalcone isomerase family protein [Hahellaceae bacterium]
MAFSSSLHFISLLLVFFSLFSTAVNARVIAGVSVHDNLPANAERPKLVLNGASIRKVFYVADVYIGSLYLEKAETNADDIFADDGYKIMSFYMLRNVRGRSIATALKEAMQLNLTPEEVLGFEAEFEMLINFLDRKMNEGETGLFEYIPGVGSKVTTGDEVKGVIPGKAFYNAILSAWIGKQPVNGTMKDEILGLSD